MGDAAYGLTRRWLRARLESLPFAHGGRVCATSDCSMTTKITLIKMRAVLAVGALLLSSGRVSAGDNPNFRLPLHATLDLGGTCSTTINCFTQLPTINVLPQREVEIYLLVFNANRLSGVQTAFEWDRALG